MAAALPGTETAKPGTPAVAGGYRPTMNDGRGSAARHLAAEGHTSVARRLALGLAALLVVTLVGVVAWQQWTITEMRSQVAALEQRAPVPGPPGPAGPPGRPGRDGTDGVDGEDGPPGPGALECENTSLVEVVTDARLTPDIFTGEPELRTDTAEVRVCGLAFG